MIIHFRQGLIRSAVVFLAIMTGLCSSSHKAHAAVQEKPNVIILFIDDLGFGDLGCFGNKRIPTPHIDALAEQGAKCTMSYITNPLCSPSRCCLMTGMFAQRFGKSGMASTWRSLSTECRSSFLSLLLTVCRSFAGQAQSTSAQRESENWSRCEHPREAPSSLRVCCFISSNLQRLITA